VNGKKLAAVTGGGFVFIKYKKASYPFNWTRSFRFYALEGNRTPISRTGILRAIRYTTRTLYETSALLLYNTKPNDCKINCFPAVFID
jgi:hypothetical protein